MKAARRVSSPAVGVRQVDCYALSGLPFPGRQNQNKHLFAPPPRRFLNYRVGSRGAAQARRSTAPPLARKYVGKILAAATTIAGTNLSKWLRGSSLTPKGQSEVSDRPPVPSVSDFSQCRCPGSWPFFCPRRPALDFFPRSFDSQAAAQPQAGQPDLPRGSTVLKAPPFQASNLAAVSWTDRKISTLSEHSNPL